MLFNETLKVGDAGGLKSYLGGIQKTMDWQTWKPFVQGAELAHIIPAIGQDLYDELISSEAVADHQLKLKEKLRLALAWFAYLEAMPSLITTTGDLGLTMPTPSNSAALPKWLFVETKKAAQDKADRYLEAALAWLEKNAESFPDWMDSEFYTIQENQLIHSASEATRYFPAIQNSRRLYLSIRGYFNAAEEDQIRPILGHTFFQALMAKQAAGLADQGTYQYEVLRLAKKAVVQLGFAQAVPFLNMNTDFRLVSETDGIVNEGVLSNERLNIIQSSAIDKGQAIASELRNYLNRVASAELFPEYFSSPLYVAPVSGGFSSRQPSNDSSNPYFIL